MVKGEAVTGRMLAVDEGKSLRDRIKADWRAFTIHATGPSSSLAGALEKGDHVDILMTRANQAAPDGQMAGSPATLLLQDVEVLAVNPKDDNVLASKLAPYEVTSATLRVKPDEAAILDQAQANGVLHLVLRGSENQASIPSTDALAERVQVGKRAFTIKAQGESATVAGFLLPGDFVDVLHSPKDHERAADSAAAGETKTILEFVEVLAVHTKKERPVGKQFEPVEVLSVTLLVSPDQAEALEQGQNSGMLGLALRNPRDQALAPPEEPEQSPAPMTGSMARTRTLRGTRLGRRLYPGSMTQDERRIVS